jgi:hypothetical protein
MESDNRIIRQVLLLLFLTITGLSSTFAQDSKQGKANTIRNLLESKRYVFKAQFVLPMRGGSRQLTTEYDMKVSKDTIEATLPYFGRAYTAPIDPGKGGIRFTSTDFKYEVEERKKGGWNILIYPKDTRDARQLILNVSENGGASLRVISNNLEPISYNGYITKIKAKR